MENLTATLTTLRLRADDARATLQTLYALLQGAAQSASPAQLSARWGDVVSQLRVLSLQYARLLDELSRASGGAMLRHYAISPRAPSAAAATAAGDPLRELPLLVTTKALPEMDALDERLISQAPGDAAASALAAAQRHNARVEQLCAAFKAAAAPLAERVEASQRERAQRPLNIASAAQQSKPPPALLAALGVMSRPLPQPQQPQQHQQHQQQPAPAIPPLQQQQQQHYVPMAAAAPQHMLTHLRQLQQPSQVSQRLPVVQQQPQQPKRRPPPPPPPPPQQQQQPQQPQQQQPLQPLPQKPVVLSRQQQQQQQALAAALAASQQRPAPLPSQQQPQQQQQQQPQPQHSALPPTVSTSPATGSGSSSATAAAAAVLSQAIVAPTGEHFERQHTLQQQLLVLERQSQELQARAHRPPTQL